MTKKTLEDNHRKLVNKLEANQNQMDKMLEKSSLNHDISGSANELNTVRVTVKETFQKEFKASIDKMEENVQANFELQGSHRNASSEFSQSLTLPTGLIFSEAILT